MEVGSVMSNQALLDRMAVGNRISCKELLDIRILIIEGCEVNLIEIVDGGVDVAIEDVVTFKLKVLLHGLQVFRNIGTILIQ